MKPPDLPPPPDRRGGFSLDRMMLVTLITALCLATMMAALRSQRDERLLLALVFNFLGMPGCAMLVLKHVMAPGPSRSWYIRAFWLTPWFALGVALTLAVPMIVFGALTSF